jgi:SAM-dependent methyltransferase
VTARPCPLCGAVADGARTSFPYATRYRDATYRYLRCRTCRAVYVDPVPAPDAFTAMYAKADYHDRHYAERDTAAYDASARLLAELAPRSARVLDYGCGVGLFVRALAREGFDAHGVELDTDAARAAARATGRPVHDAAAFWDREEGGAFDVIHLGDVLEHLPEPVETTHRLLARLAPGGLLFLEGPLEENASPVFWAARAFGAVRRRLQPGRIGTHPPTHLLRVDAAQQRAFFARLGMGAVTFLHWSVEETGWPYAGRGRVEDSVARVACAVGGRSLAGMTFGNRFRAVVRVHR